MIEIIIQYFLKKFYEVLIPVQISILDCREGEEDGGTEKDGGTEDDKY